MSILFLVRSRSLLSLDYGPGLRSKACDWFRHVFMRESTSDLYFTNDHSRSVVLYDNITSTLYNRILECR